MLDGLSTPLWGGQAMGSVLGARNGEEMYSGGKPRLTSATWQRSRRRHIAATIGLLTVLSIALAGCSGQGVTLSPKDTNISACTDRAPVAVADIGRHKRYDCDYSSVEFVFPDGFRQKAPGIGEEEGSQAPHKAGHPVPSYRLANLGVYGVVASEVSANGKHTQWWGTPEGLAKSWAAFGKTRTRISDS